MRTGLTLLLLGVIVGCVSEKSITTVNSAPGVTITSHSDGDIVSEGYVETVRAQLSDTEQRENHRRRLRLNQRQTNHRQRHFRNTRQLPGSRGNDISGLMEKTWDEMNRLLKT